ncbi:hypothetical protein EVAR_62944_1 [Eumeta japonica]|uniref:Uncharacterized protein n=1 Tax=Eumeta variegata TaxID=151549 RepID=A0A4C1ZC40_EUMVA|nr:hypothetical protein EVAR_62944_1 [Eumeta japonica]
MSCNKLFTGRALIDGVFVSAEPLPAPASSRTAHGVHKPREVAGSAGGYRCLAFSPADRCGGAVSALISGLFSAVPVPKFRLHHQKTKSKHDQRISQDNSDKPQIGLGSSVMEY